MLVAISGTAVGLLPECRSASHQNVGRHHAGIVVGMDRNTHQRRKMKGITPKQDSNSQLTDIMLNAVLVPKIKPLESTKNGRFHYEICHH